MSHSRHGKGRYQCRDAAAKQAVEMNWHKTPFGARAHASLDVPQGRLPKTNPPAVTGCHRCEITARKRPASGRWAVRGRFPGSRVNSLSAFPDCSSGFGNRSRRSQLRGQLRQEAQKLVRIPFSCPTRTGHLERVDGRIRNCRTSSQTRDFAQTCRTAGPRGGDRSANRPDAGSREPVRIKLGWRDTSDSVAHYHFCVKIVAFARTAPYAKLHIRTAIGLASALTRRVGCGMVSVGKPKK